MCFYDQHRYACGDWKWGYFRQHCNREWRTGETCGMKLIMQTVPVSGKCKLCEKIDTRQRRRHAEADRILRWRREGSQFSASIDRAQDIIKNLDQEIRSLQHDRRARIRPMGGVPRTTVDPADESNETPMSSPSGSEYLSDSLTDALVLGTKATSIASAESSSCVRPFMRDDDVLSRSILAEQEVASGPGKPAPDRLSPSQLEVRHHSQANAETKDNNNASWFQKESKTGAIDIFPTSLNVLSLMEEVDPRIVVAVNSLIEESLKCDYPAAAADMDFVRSITEACIIRQLSTLNEAVLAVAGAYQDPGDTSILPKKVEKTKELCDLNADDRLADPTAHFSDLQELQSSVFINSSLHISSRSSFLRGFNKTYIPSDPQKWINAETKRLRGSALAVVQTYWPRNTSFEVIQNFNNSLLRLTTLRDCMYRTLANIEHLRARDFCGDSFNLISISKERQQVGQVCSIHYTDVERIARNLQELLRLRRNMYLSEDAEKLWCQDSLTQEFYAKCRDLLRGAKLLSLDAQLRGVPDFASFHSLCKAIVQILDLVVLSFAGGHVASFDEEYLGQKQDKFCIAFDDPVNFPGGQRIIVKRRKLRCLDAFLRGRSVWVFHGNDTDNPDVPSGAVEELYLSTTVSTLADMWGPLWAVAAKRDSGKIFAYKMGNGTIVRKTPSGVSAQSEPVCVNGEALCHWMNSREYNQEVEFEKSEGMYFNSAQRLLIGAGSMSLQQNQFCPGPEIDAIRKFRTKKSLSHTRVSRPHMKLDTQIFQVQGGGMGINGTYGRTYKFENGQTWKEALIERWEMEPKRRNPRALEHYFSVEVSACTLNARRQPLIKTLGSHTMLRYLEAIGYQWSSRAIEEIYRAAVQSEDCSSFRRLYHSLPDAQTELGTAIVTSMKALEKTGVEDN